MSAFHQGARLAIQEELNALRAVLNGGKVGGIQLGDPGITRNWVRQAIADREGMLARMDRGVICKACGAALPQPSRLPTCPDCGAIKD